MSNAKMSNAQKILEIRTFHYAQEPCYSLRS